MGGSQSVAGPAEAVAINQEYLPRTEQSSPMPIRSGTGVNTGTEVGEAVFHVGRENQIAINHQIGDRFDAAGAFPDAKFDAVFNRSVDFGP